MTAYDDSQGSPPLMMGLARYRLGRDIMGRHRVSCQSQTRLATWPVNFLQNLE